MVPWCRSGVVRYVHCLLTLLLYEPVLGALSVNATVCESMELGAAVGSNLLRKPGGNVAYFVSAVGSSFFTPHIDVAHVRHWFGEVKMFPQISRLLQVPGRRGAGPRFASRNPVRQP